MPGGEGGDAVEHPETRPTKADDRLKDDFIAVLAHELRNPLSHLRTGLQVIRLSDDRAVRDRAQAMMDRQLTHVVRLIDDLLDVSRITRNKMDLRRARVTLADVVGHAVETARPAVDEAGHELTVDLPAEPVVLDADLTRLAQVFSNLLINSAKYTGRGGRIWLTAERSPDGVAVSVRDTGIGIPAEVLPRIFEMFLQVGRPTERAAGGLGIGLALAKGLVEMHGGAVAAASGGPGLGSTFTVILPEPTEDPPPAGSAAEGGPVGPRPPRRILVVDDNRDGSDSLAMMLRLLDNEVETASDGAEAVDRVEAFRPEVVLMDLGMPRVDGLEATRRIRGHPCGRGMADGSNEVAAIPELLRALDLAGAIVTIDAAGCQTGNARLIRDAGGHYLLAVKDNQPTLRAAVEAVFDRACEADFAGVATDGHESTDDGHGRHEERSVTVVHDPTGLPPEWPGAAAVVQVDRVREAGGKRTRTTHFYLTSHRGTAAELGDGVRGHWAIEAIPWVLDVAFREDESRTRAGHAGANLGMIRRVAVSLLKRAEAKVSIHTRRLMAAWDDEFLLKVVQGIPAI